MADSSTEDLASQLYKWAYQEMFFHPRGTYANSKRPTQQDFREMCRGPAIDIWRHVIRHVYSTQTVRKVKGNLALKKREKPDEYQVEYGGSGRYCEEMRSLEEQKAALSSQVSHLLSDIRHLQTEQTRLHTELIDTESSYESSTSRIRDNRRKAMLLRIYSEKCGVEVAQTDDFSQRLTAKAQKMCSKTRKKSEEAYFTKEGTEGRKGSETEIETACCKCVRESCQTIGKFLHEVLQGSFGNDRTVFHRRKDQLWLSVEHVLSEYPIAQILQALMVCTQDSIIHIREKTAAINIRKDAERLQFKYENTGALVDLSSKGNVLQGLHELQEVCQSRHIQRFFETEKNKNEAWRLGQQTDSILSKIDKLLQRQFQGKSAEMDAARKVIEAKLELASLKAALSCYQDEGKKLQSSVQKATKQTELLMMKYRKIQDFKELAQKKQQLIRILVRQNSNSFSRLSSQRSEIVDYVDRSLSGHREQIVTVVDRYQGAIQREVEKFASLSLPYLLHVWLDSVTKVAALDMCIHQIDRGPTTTAGKTLLQTMAALKYPVFKAPEYLLLRCVEVKAEIEEMEDLLQYHDNQGQHLTQSSHGRRDTLTFMNNLCEQVRAYDKCQLEEVLPLLNRHIDQATRGLADCLQLKDTVRDWWEQPAQYTVPWLKVDNMNIQQWKDKWTVVSTGIRQSQT